MMGGIVSGASTSWGLEGSFAGKDLQVTVKVAPEPFSKRRQQYLGCISAMHHQ